MFTIIRPEERPQYDAELDDMFRMRYRIAVTEWGWDIPGIAPGYDRDQFDTDETVYIIVRREDGSVAGTSRLNPTTSPHMMSELFASYCDLQPFPVGPDVHECSRFIIDRRAISDPVEEFRIRCSVGIGLIVYCLDNKITRLSWLTHQKFYNLVQKVWRTEPLGLPKREADNWAWIPAVSYIDRETLDRQLDRYRNADTLVTAWLANRLPDADERVA